MCPCRRPNLASEMQTNVCPAPLQQQPSTYGMIPTEDRLSHVVSSVDDRDHSHVTPLQQDAYNNGDGDRERWRPVLGQSHHGDSADASFRSQYSGFDERAMGDRVMWPTQNEVNTFHRLHYIRSSYHMGRICSAA